MDGLEAGAYTSDLVYTKAAGGLMVQECVFRKFQMRIFPLFPALLLLAAVLPQKAVVLSACNAEIDIKSQGHHKEG